MPQLTALELIDHIDPASLDYQEWVNCGMALKDAGFTASDWDDWSKRDSKRYHAGDCFKKWGSFAGSPPPPGHDGHVGTAGQRSGMDTGAA